MEPLQCYYNLSSQICLAVIQIFYENDGVSVFRSQIEVEEKF